ncbi:MAG TPA: hypothetical protein VGP76_13025 [Planctomycetaceae bacterium]|jgi:hypothetical protein|nr:hypothetical protein [Planctomycetaceae bacterium]
MLTVSDVARDIENRTGQTVSPQEISNLFYRRILDHRRCPLTGRVRLIPPDYLPGIEQVLRERGILSAEATSCP